MQARRDRIAARGAETSGGQPVPAPPGQAYDRRRLTYANTFDSPLRAFTIRALEWFTGKITIIRMLREFQRRGPHDRRDIWGDALDIMRIRLDTPQDHWYAFPIALHIYKSPVFASVRCPDNNGLQVVSRVGHRI